MGWKKLDPDTVKNPEVITDFLNKGGDEESARVLEQWLDASYRITNAHGYKIEEPRARLVYLIQRKRRLTLEKRVLLIGALLAFWGAVWPVYVYFNPGPQPPTEIILTLPKAQPKPQIQPDALHQSTLP